jgi:hypothetical protein
MAKKVAIVDIKLTGLNTISQLEQELQDINKQLKNIDVNSQEFAQLSQQAQAATAKLEGVNQSLKGVTSVERSDAVKKMGEGLVGAFQVGAGASLIFGEKTGEQLTRVIGKVAGLYSAVDGIDKLTKAFSKENLSRLGFLGDAFKSVGTQAKAAGTATKVAGTTMKTALISTGIGALIVAVGLLIANWDKLTSAIKRNREEKKRAEEKKAIEAEITLNEKLLAAYEKEAEAQKKINDINDESYKNREIELETIRKKQEDITAQLKLQQNEQETLIAQQEKSNEIIENSAEKMALYEQMMKNGADAAGIWYATNARKNENEKKSLKTTEDALKVNKANTSEMQKQLELLKTQEEDMLKIGNIIKDVFKPFYERQIELIDARLGRLTKENELLASQKFQGDKIYKNQQEINDLQEERLDYEEKIAGEQTQENINAEVQLEIQKKINAQLNKNRIEALQTEIARLDVARAYRKNTDELLEKLAVAREDDEYSKEGFAESNELLQQRLRLKELEAEKQAYITQQQINAYPFDEKGLQILKERLGLRSDEVKFGSELEGISISTDKLSQRQLLTYYDEVTAMNSIYNTKKDILQLESDSYDKTIEALNNQSTIQMMIAGQAASKAEALQEDRDALIATDLTGKSLEYQLDIKKQIADLDAEIAGYNADANSAMVESNALANDAANLNLRQVEIKNDIAILDEEHLIRQQQITYEIEQQSRLSAQLNEFVSQYGEEIQAAQAVMNAWFEHAFMQFDELAKRAEKDLKKAQKELDRLNKQQAKSGDKLKDLQEQLRDADGQRYDELLAMIYEEQNAQALGATAVQEQIAAQEEAEKNAINAKMKAEYEKAKLEKKQALINAAINTALAVIKALPNVFLAAAAGIAGGIGIATIAAQKVPEPEYLADGGLLEGASHNQGGIPVGRTGIEVEGGEYVINKRSTASYLPLLEAINDAGKRKFADGGQLPAVQTQIQQEFIDYDKLADAVLRGIQPSVSVVEINRVQNRVRVIEQNASL